MAPRGKSRRSRSRKRRPAVAAPAGAAAESSVAGAAEQAPPAAATRAAPAPAPAAKRPRARERNRAAASRGRGGGSGGLSMSALGERPTAPWHPLPLSELLILVGAIGTIVGFSRGLSHGGAPLIAGLAAVAIGTVEVTLREHLSGYRSHTILLALLPTIAFHSAVVLIVAAFARPPQALNVALLAVDLALFAVLFKLLRARFADARRERIFREGP